MKEIKTVDDYINNYSDDLKEILTNIRKIIIKNIPFCEERMSWGMPTFYWKENVIHFAVGKKHIGIYPSASPIIYFKDSLADYKTSKGAIQLPLNKPIPYNLIKKIVQFRVKEIIEKYE